MKNALQAFLKKPTTFIGVVTAMMFQLIFSIVWMTGYDGVSDNIDQLKIAIVNEDQGIGKQVAQNLQKNLPFKSVIVDTAGIAQQKLNEREVQMVMHIPADFSAQLQTPGTVAQIEYTVNESNPALIKSIMSGAASNITATVNKQAIAAGAQAMLTQANIEAGQAAGMAEGMSEKVASDMKYTNRVEGMANQMIPMMMVLASYVGAMIMGMNMEQSAMAIGSSVNKWQRFSARSIINVVAAVIVALVGTSLVHVLGGQSVHGFFTMWAFQTLFVMTFMFVAQIFLLLFGMSGMLFNIIMLSAQLVSSGAMVPRELLSGFYAGLSKFMPATYAVEGNMNLLFGGPSLSSDSWSLVWIMLSAAVIGLAAVALRKEPANARAFQSGPLGETA